MKLSERTINPARMWPDDNAETTDPETGERHNYNTEVRVRNQTWLDEYLARGLQGLGARHREAAALYWQVYYQSGLERGCTGNYDGFMVDAQDPHWATPQTDRQLTNRVLFRKWGENVGEQHRQILNWSVVEDVPAWDIGQRRTGLRHKQSAAAAGLALIKSALSELADQLNLQE